MEKPANTGEAHRGRLVLALPDLGLLQEEQTVQQHGGHGDKADAEGDAPHGVQRVVVILAAGLPEGGQKDAQHRGVDQVAPALQEQGKHFLLVL